MKTTTIKFALIALLTIFSASIAQAGFLYTLNVVVGGGANNIYGYSVNETTGALTAIPGVSPLATGGTGGTIAGSLVSEQLTIDRVNNRLYAINDGNDTISAYSINTTTGALTALPFSPIALPAGLWVTIAVHPSGSPLIVSSANSNASASYVITPLTATAAAGSPYTTGTAVPFSSVFSRDGNYFYTGGNFGNSFAGFSVNAVTGVLTALAGSPFNSGNANPLGLTTDAQGRLFLVNATNNQLRAFTTTAGIPAAATGNPFVSGLSVGIDGALSPNGNFYVVADRGGSRVGSYQIAGAGAATTLTAVAGSPFASGGTFTDAVVFNGVGNLLFAANGDSRNITKYDFNPATGVLSNTVVQPADTNGAAGRLVGLDYLSAVVTAAGVSVAGRVTNGRNGLENAFVTLTDEQGNERKTRTNSFGYFSFDDIAAGQTYIVQVRARRYQFAPQVISVNDNLTGLVFSAIE